MSWRHSVFLASRELRRRAGRAVLTVLAVALAAALLTALLTIALTAKTKVLDELAKGGPLSGVKVAAARPDPSQAAVDNAQPGAAAILDQAAVDQIGQLPFVRSVVPIGVVGVTVVADHPKRDGTPLAPFVDRLVGVDITSVPSLPITVLSGRLPAPGSTTEVTVDEGFLQRVGFDRATAGEVVGSQVDLATDRPVRIGDQLQYVQRWTTAEIVGVVAQDAGSGQVLADSALLDPARQWIAGQIRGDGIGPQDIDPLAASPFGAAFVVADSIDHVGAVRVEVAALGYSTSAPENIIASVDRYLRVVEIVLTSVGVIALAVAAIGISNAALASVRERRRDIGVLKAVGATDRDIRRIFLVESGALGLIGGVIGVVLGYLTAVAVAVIVNRYLIEQGFGAVPVQVPVVTMIGVTVGATLLAVVAGTLPAAKAARLPAREAMGSL